MREIKTFLITIMACVYVAICLISCQPKIVLHPIETIDIISVPAGSSIYHDSSLITIEKDGWYLSDVYIKEVMEAKVE